MSDLSKRIAAIEKATSRLGGAQCHTCESWGRPILVFEDGGRDGSEEIPDHSRCPDCGWEPDRPTVVVINYVDSVGRL